MPRVPAISPVTGLPTSPDFIHTLASSFVDSSGRTLLLRGVNLSGSSKAPVDQPSYQLEGFWESAEAGGTSFVGRPLNLDDGSADVHLARLRGWGFNCLRYPVTWESLEHAGPGKLDYDFMDYTVRVLRKCKEHGFKVYMDPHQDVWSRFSGGSGAPFWTLAACGLNPHAFTATQSALVHCEYPTADAPDPANIPAMIWGTNYGRLASLTLFTFFFGGRAFAPKCVIDGMNIQDYLQSHYIAAMGALADRIRAAGDLLDSCVLGWDSMNEPFEGLIGFPDLNKPSEAQTAQLKKGTAPTPAQSLRLGMGQAQTLDTWGFGGFGPRKEGKVTVDPQGVRLWAAPESEPGGKHARWGWTRDAGWRLGDCVWAQHGVWDPESGDVLEPEYFKFHPAGSPRAGERVDYVPDFWAAHFVAFAARIRQAHPEAMLFVAPPVFHEPPPLEDAVLRGRAVYSTHYYDGLTLVTRHWNWFNADALGVLRGRYASPVLAVKVGEAAIRRSFREQLGELKQDAVILGAYPTMIGEIGTPFDMDGRRAYGHTDGGKYKGDYSSQQKALDASLNAADGPNALNFTIWTYCPDSSHQWGDLWNMEDLSLWSADDLRAAVRQEAAMARVGMHESDDSQATLVRRAGAPAKGWVRQASTSAVSLATLSVGGGRSAADLLDTTVPPSPVIPPSPPLGGVATPALKGLAGAADWAGVYELLTDGARAVKAFCRPYPRATVGVPAGIDFDIAKTLFKLTVRVTAADAPAAAAAEDGPDKGEVATEIYVPLVHYASDAVVARIVGVYPNDDADESASTTPPSPGAETGASTPTLLDAVPSPLSLDVKVSSGRWEVEGQCLRWWYEVPTEDGDEREYTIEVRRKGGAIKTAEEREREARAQDWKCQDLVEGCVVQ